MPTEMWTLTPATGGAFWIKNQVDPPGVKSGRASRGRVRPLDHFFLSMDPVYA